MRPHLEIRRRPGPEIRMGGLTLTPVIRSIAIRLGRGGLHWVAPVGVRVSREGQASYRVRIMNITRMFQAGIALAAVFLLVATGLLRARKERT